MRRSPIVEDRVRRRRRTAKYSPQPREELVDAERLRHVVVRARVKCGDLLALLAHGREHDHRGCRPRPQLAAHIRAAAVRKDEVEDHRLGRMRGRRDERLLCRRRRVDGVAGAAERRAKRPQDLRLVVDDEDALPAHACNSAGTSTTGSASANDAPCPGRDSAHTRPPLASAKPRAIASPRPAPERESPMRR